MNKTLSKYSKREFDVRCQLKTEYLFEIKTRVYVAIEGI